MTTYNWGFPALEAYPQSSGESNVIFTVHYRLDGEDGLGHSAGIYGTVGVTYTAGEPFTPFDQLTKEQVQGWVEDALGTETVAAAKASIDQQIEDQINPKVVVLTPSLELI